MSQKRKRFVLDEDDYALIEENNKKIHRPENKKFKRLKKANTEGPLDGIPEEEKQKEEEYISKRNFIVDDNDLSKGRKKLKPKEARLQVAACIFGGYEKLLQARKKKESDEWRERRLDEEFEPSIVEQQFMTVNDSSIRSTDIPERLQILESIIGPPSVEPQAILKEAKWIYDQLVSGSAPLLERRSEGEYEASVKGIEKFLSFTHIEKFDVPSIAMYRKYDCMSLLKEPEEDETDHAKPTVKRHKVLWEVHELDKKWLFLQKRKRTLLLSCQKVFKECQRVDDDETRLIIVRALEDAESWRAVDDVDSRFKLFSLSGEVDLKEGKFKSPPQRSTYRCFSKAGLLKAARKFGCSSQQLGQRISSAKVEGNELEDSELTPENMASEFVCPKFETPQAVLVGARGMAAVEISCEPVVREHFRSIYFENALVSTTPTARGYTVIDSSHEFSRVQWLCDKPLGKFKDAQWLLIQKAEEEKLLQVTIKLQKGYLGKGISDYHEKYFSCGVSKSTKLWNEQRKIILRDAIFTHLLPSMEKEARHLLTSKAKNWLLSEYGKLLWDKVSVAPYQQKEGDMHADKEAAPRIMACCWSPGKPATTFVMLDADGQIEGVMETNLVSVSDIDHKKNEQKRLSAFMEKHKPTVVAIG